MKNSRTMIVLAVLVAAVVAVAVAQNTWNGQDIEVKFKVPMAFYAGDKLLPAGEYEAKQNGGEQAGTEGARPVMKPILRGRRRPPVRSVQR